MKNSRLALLGLACVLGMLGCAHNRVAAVGDGHANASSSQRRFHIQQAPGPERAFVLCDRDCAAHTPKVLDIPAALPVADAEPPKAPVPPPAPEVAKVDVFFSWGSARLQKTELNKLRSAAATARTGGAVSVEGFTDPTGRPANNPSLARRRAEAARAALVKYGVEARRIAVSVPKNCCEGGEGADVEAHKHERRATVRITISGI